MTNPQVSAKQAEAPVVVAQNRVFMAGEILALTDTGIVLKTTNKNRAGDRSYEENHPIVVDPAKITAAGFDVGARIQFYGLIAAQENKVQRVHAFPATLAKAAASTDANMVKLAGFIGTTTYTPPDSIIGKQGFARSFVNTATPGQPSRNVRVVMFQDMGRIWAKVPPGSEVVIQGRVRDRERGGYVDANGDLAVYTEVVADAATSRVVKAAVVIDAFAGVDFAKLEAEAGFGSTAEAPQAEAVQAEAVQAEAVQAEAVQAEAVPEEKPKGKSKAAKPEKTPF